MKKFLASILAIVFVFMSFPLISFAENDELVHYKFDFGGLGAADGYIGVSATEEYSDSKGYGFANLVTVNNVLSSGEGANADAVEFNTNGGRHYFSVKLPVGLYKITVTTGDVQSTTISTSKDGQEGIPQLFFMTGNNATDSFIYAATDGKLNIHAGRGVGDHHSISALEIEQISPEAESNPTIWVTGDSTVASYYNRPDSSAHGWGQYLSDYIDTNQYFVHNVSISGIDSASMIRSILPTVEAFGKSGDILLYSVGINDYTAQYRAHNGNLSEIDPSSYIANVTEVVRRAKAKGMRVILVKQQGEVTDSYAYPVIQEKWFGRQLDQIAEAEGVETLDLFNSWLQFCLQKTYTVAKEYYSIDDYGSLNSLHPNLAGARVLASMVGELLFPSPVEPDPGPDPLPDDIYNATNVYTYITEPSGEVITNPHKGFVMDIEYPGQFDSDAFYSMRNNPAWNVVTICNSVFFWKDLNPGEDVYDWSSLDAMLEACEDHGMTLGLRVIPYTTGAGSDANYGASHDFVPQWVYDNGCPRDLATYKWRENSPQIYIPHWSDQHYIDAYKKFITALADRYDGDPRLEFVDIRAFGNFGEWHTSQFVGNEMPSEEQQIDMIAHYAHEFQHTMVCAMSDVRGRVYEAAIELGVAKRNDGFIMTPNVEYDLVPAYNANLPTVADNHNTYKYMLNPTSSEYLPWTVQRFRESIDTAHLSIYSLDLDSEFGIQIYHDHPDLINEYVNRLGYNFTVTSATQYDNRLVVTIKNTGLASCFFDIDLCADITDADGNVIESFGSPIRIESGSFRDGMERTFIFEYGGTFDPSYNVSLSMYDVNRVNRTPVTYASNSAVNPTVRFDNLNNLPNNRLLLVRQTPDTCTVTFDMNGHGSQIDSQIIDYGASVVAPSAPSAEGWIFDGWYSDSSFTNVYDFGASVENNITLYAKWTAVQSAPVTYTVSFNSNGGSAVSSQTVTEGGYATQVTPTRSGYTFEGWYVNSECTESFSFIVPVTSDVTLYAKWAEIVVTHDVVFHYNATPAGSVPNTLTVNHDSLATAPSTNPTRAGYLFDGWYDNSACTGTPHNFATPVTANQDLYAKWTPIVYTIIFHSNGGSAVSTQFVEFGSTVTKPADPVRAGFIFAGWYANATFTEAFNFARPVSSNSNVYAKWTPVVCTVTYNSNGGTSVSSQSVNYGSTVTKPLDPTRTGFTFAGWYTNAACTYSYNFANPVTDNVTLYAKWTPVVCTVTYDSNGGTSVSSQTVNYGSTVTKPLDPIKTGFTFAGWYTNSACTDAYNFANDVTSNTTLYAKWAPVICTVAFNSNGGTSVSSQNVNHGSTATKPTDPTRTGYTFGGWYIDSACTSAYAFSTPVTDDVTLYAKWEQITYVVTFDSNSGSTVPSQTVNYGAAVTKPTDPTRIGYTFAGWYTNAACTDTYNFANTVTSNITLYADWTPIPTYDVTFNVVGTTVAPQTVNSGATATKPLDPTRAGYTFGGWYTDSAFTSEYVFSTPVAGDITLYGKWVPVIYTVAFNSNSGTAVTSQTMNYGASATKPNDPTRTGHTFGGWYIDAAFTSEYEFSTPVTSDVTLYAKWTPITYVVTFDRNDGSATSSQTADYGTTVSKPADPTRTGYTFEGWYTDSACTNAYDFTSEVTSNVTLYAKWELATYTVSFDVDDGSTVTPQTMNHGASATKPNDPTRTGYTFGGWYIDEAFTSEYVFSTPVTGNVTLYAKWTPITYVVTFDSNDGTAISSQSADYGTTVSKPVDPTRTGYTFEGWYTDSAFTSEYVFSTPVAGDITLYAKWEEEIVTYNVVFDYNVSDVESVPGTNVPNTQVVVSGDKVTAVVNPLREGYTFEGWYVDSSCTTSFDFDTSVTSNITLYAKWELIPVITYEITFADGVDDEGITVPATITVVAGDTIPTVTAPTREGYTFLGWKTADGTEVIPGTTLATASIELIAQWEANAITPDIVVPDPTTPENNVPSETTPKPVPVPTPAEETNAAQQAPTPTPTPTSPVVDAVIKTGEVTPTYAILAVVLIMTSGFVFYIGIRYKKDEE